MAQLANALSYVKAIETERQVLKLTPGEAAIASGLAGALPQPQLDAETLARFAPFEHWCESVAARNLPAKPITVAGYVLSTYGANTDFILDALDAIQAVHDYHGLASPVHTMAVRYALDHVATIKAPRGWRDEEKILFQLLPADIRAALSRRERDRETALRRAQNEIAEERKRLQGGAEQSAETEKETTMAKKEGHLDGVGPYSKNDVKMTRDTHQFSMGRDISKLVDPNHKRNDGFGAKLDNPSKE